MAHDIADGDVAASDVMSFSWRSGSYFVRIDQYQDG